LAGPEGREENAVNQTDCLGSAGMDTKHLFCKAFAVCMDSFPNFRFFVESNIDSVIKYRPISPSKKLQRTHATGPARNTNKVPAPVRLTAVSRLFRFFAAKLNKQTFTQSG